MDGHSAKGGKLLLMNSLFSLHIHITLELIKCFSKIHWMYKLSSMYPLVLCIALVFLFALGPPRLSLGLTGPAGLFRVVLTFKAGP